MSIEILVISIDKIVYKLLETSIMLVFYEQLVFKKALFWEVNDVKFVFSDMLQFKRKSLGFNMKEAVIVSGARTAIGKFGGALKDVSAPKLGAAAIRGALKFSGINSDDVDEVVFGNSIQGAEAG